MKQLKITKEKKTKIKDPLNEMLYRIAKNAGIREDILYLQNVGKFLIKLSKRIVEDK